MGEGVGVGAVAVVGVDEGRAVADGLTDGNGDGLTDGKGLEVGVGVGRTVGLTSQPGNALS